MASSAHMSALKAKDPENPKRLEETQLRNEQIVSRCAVAQRMTSESSREADMDSARTHLFPPTFGLGPLPPPSLRLPLSRRGAQGRSGEQPTQRQRPSRSVLPLKPTIRSVAAAQDCLHRWWMSSLSTFAHVRKCVAAQDNKSVRSTFHCSIQKNLNLPGLPKEWSSLCKEFEEDGFSAERVVWLKQEFRDQMRTVRAEGGKALVRNNQENGNKRPIER